MPRNPIKRLQNFRVFYSAGFDLVPDQELLLADTPTEFAAAVVALLRDAERRQRLGCAARRFAGSRYDWRMIVPQLERAYSTEPLRPDTQ